MEMAANSLGDADVWMLGSESREHAMTSEVIVKLSIILLISVTSVLANISLIITITSVPGPKEVINFYLLSLSVSDLIGGLLVAPVSVYPALAGRWPYGSFCCHLVGYLMVSLWVSQVLTLMWIGVDRYLAIVKPLRYDTIQTKVRSQCWMCVSWLSAALLCCPPLFGFSSTIYDSDAYICMTDWSDMVGYSSTVALMVLGPPVITTVYTYSYIFHMSARIRTSYTLQLDKEFVSAITENLANPNIVMSLILSILFWLSWLPFVVLRLHEFCSGYTMRLQHLHFALFWLGMLNSVWKVVVCYALCPLYRRVIYVVVRWFCCLRRRSATPTSV